MILTGTELMQGMSEDEGDDDGPEVKVDEEKLEAARKAREERQEKLRKMMDDDGKLFKVKMLLMYFLIYTRRGNARCPHYQRFAT